MRAIKTFKKDQTYFDDIEIGSLLPELTKKYELGKWAVFMAVHGDFYKPHFDSKAAEGQKDDTAHGPHGFGMQISAHMSQLVTDWISPNGVLKKIKCLTRSPIYDGDVRIMKGKVTRKYTENGENFVQLDLWGEHPDGKLGVSGSATVILPSRKRMVR